jgi:hypothetical protein
MSLYLLPALEQHLVKHQITMQNSFKRYNKEKDTCSCDMSHVVHRFYQGILYFSKCHTVTRYIHKHNLIFVLKKSMELTVYIFIKHATLKRIMYKPLTTNFAKNRIINVECADREFIYKNK